MKLSPMKRIRLAVVLSISLIATGCSAQWVNVALADLPVLTQMALNFAALVATLQLGKQVTPSEALAIQNISGGSEQGPYPVAAAAQRLQGGSQRGRLAEDRKHDSGNEPGIAGALAGGPHQRPRSFGSHHGGSQPDPHRVSSFASLIPQAPSTSRKAARQNTVIPQPKDLRRQWNQQVCAPTGNASLDAALSQRVLP